MKKVFLLIFVAEMYSFESSVPPDILLTGKSFANDYLYQFICSTNIAVWQCSVEFLIERSTYDDIKYIDNTCYHKHGICSPNICACSDSCKSFTLNVTVTEDMQNHTYSCGTRIVKGEVVFFANITVQWDKNDGFQTLKKTIVPVIQSSTSSKSDTDKWIILSTVIGSISCICTVIVLSLSCRRICGAKQHEDISGVSVPPQGSRNEYSNGNNHDNRQHQAQHDSRDKTSNDRYPDNEHQAQQNCRNITHNDRKSKFEHQAQQNSWNKTPYDGKPKYIHREQDNLKKTSNNRQPYNEHQEQDNLKTTSNNRQPYYEHQEQDNLKKTSNNRQPYYEHQEQDNLKKTSDNRQPYYEHQEQDNLNKTSNNIQPYYGHQAPHSSRDTLSHVHSQEYLKTQELKSSWNKMSSYQDLDNQSAHNSKNTPSLPRNQKYRHAPAAPHNSQYTPSLHRNQEYRHTPVPQTSNKAPTLIRTPEYRHPQVPQTSNKAPTLIRTPEYRHPQDQNSTMNNLNLKVFYSNLPGYRRSTSTQSTSSGEGLSIYNIHVENKVLLPGQDLNESNA